MDPDEREAQTGSGEGSRSSDSQTQVADKILRQFAAQPGQARHGVTALRSVELEFDRDVPGDENDASLGTLRGHFSVFNEWTEIRSMFEGHFMERIAPGAFSKTLAENKGIRCLFQHGKDPSIGMKILGPFSELREDEKGGYYEVPLDDTSYNRDLLPGLRKGLYGASFRFEVLREEIVQRPERSAHNPKGIEERTVVEARVRELGPVTFGAYSNATAGVRSVTDDYLLEMQQEIGPMILIARSAERLRELQSSGEPSPAEPQEEAAAAPATTTESEREEETPPSEETTGEGESRDAEGTPSTEAPDELRSVEDRLRTTRLSSAVQPLRTSHEKERPIWKL